MIFLFNFIYFLPFGLILGKIFWSIFFPPCCVQAPLSVPAKRATSRETTKTSLQLAYILNLFCVFVLL